MGILVNLLIYFRHPKPLSRIKRIFKSILPFSGHIVKYNELKHRILSSYHSLIKLLKNALCNVDILQESLEIQIVYIHACLDHLLITNNMSHLTNFTVFLGISTIFDKFFINISGTSCLRDLVLTVPPAASLGETVQLNCSYHLQVM